MMLIADQHVTCTTGIDDMIYYLSRGPDQVARVFNRCFINGFLFRVSSIENSLTTQNSGVFVKGDASTGDMDWYGVLRKIICLDFLVRRN